jgi:hypothetical protein
MRERSNKPPLLLLADDRAMAAPIPVESAVARSIGEHPDPDSQRAFDSDPRHPDGHELSYGTPSSGQIRPQFARLHVARGAAAKT